MFGGNPANPLIRANSTAPTSHLLAFENLKSSSQNKIVEQKLISLHFSRS